jgi:hypothetical protein
MAWAQRAQQKKKQRAMSDAATTTACSDARRGLDRSHCAWLGSPEHWSAGAGSACACLPRLLIPARRLHMRLGSRLTTAGHCMRFFEL